MPAKKKNAPVTDLPGKPVNTKQADSVKGGRPGRLAANHNQTLR